MHDLVDYVTHMNWVDYLFLVIIVYSVVTGAWIGFLAECTTLAGIAVGIFAAGQIYSGVGTVLGHLNVPVDARDWAGFVAVFLAISMLFRIASLFARNVSRAMIRGWSNSVAGGLLGLVVGGALCLTIIYAVAYFKVGSFVDPVHRSKLAHSSINLLPELTSLLPTKMHHIEGFVN